MMSIFELTLLSWLHCQPEMSRVSLLPVANVVSSPVQNFVVEVESMAQLAPDSKSRMNVAVPKVFVGPTLDGLLATVSAVAVSVTVNRSAQSFWFDGMQVESPAGQRAL